MSQQQPPPYPTQPGYAPPPQQGGYAPPYPPQQPSYQQQYPGHPGYPQQQPPYGGPGGAQAYGAFQGQQAMMAGQMRNQTMGGYDSDVEGGGGDMGGAGNLDTFSDKAVRRGFIRKVYGILCIQLLVTMAIMAPFAIEGSSARLYAKNNRWLYWTAFGATLICMIALVCCESVRRKAPTNYIFLGIFTACEGLMLGTIAAYYETEAVLIAVGACAAVTLGLTIFAFQTKYDFTTCGGMLCGALVILMIAGILMIFMPYNKYAVIGYGSAGALIFSMYIVYDTQLMMGGSHKYSLSPEEYIFAALNLYLDIINLFLYILMIVGAARGD